MRVARLLIIVVVFLGAVTYYALNRPKEGSAPAMSTCQAYAEAVVQRLNECRNDNKATIEAHRAECEAQVRPTDECIERVRQLSCANVGGDWRRRVESDCAKKE